jgi:hypothetical protein
MSAKQGVFCAFFGEAANTTGFIALNDWVIYELGRILQEAVMAYSRYYPCTCLKGLRKSTKPPPTV